MQEDAEFLRVAELLASIADRAIVAGTLDVEVNQVIRDWLPRLVVSDEDLKSVLAEKIDRAFPI